MDIPFISRIAAPTTARFTHLLFHPRERVVDWFARPGAVRRLTPGWLPMTPTQEAGNLRDGTTTFDMPAGLTWVAEHDPEDYVAGHRFADRVTNQPFRRTLAWRHVHRFEDVRGPGEDHPAWWTNVVDEVTSRAPRRAIAGVFAYRAAVLEGDFAAADRLAAILDPERDGDVSGENSARPHPLNALPHKRIAVSGASGTVGSMLCALLSTSGHDVVKLTRSNSTDPGTRTWDPESPAADLLEGIDVLIHLAGAPIAGRFTDKHLARVRDSRVGPSRKLAEVAASAGLEAVVSASAVGYYGSDRGTELLDEAAPAGDGPLADIVRDWEAAWDPARDAGVRVVNVRTGLVQAGGGGLLPLLAGITSTGLGGKLGDGGQWFPWIALDDLLDVYHRAALDPAWSGPFNAVAPNGVDNETYTKTLAKVLRRPAAIPVPKAAPKLVLGGRGADELAFANQRAIPRALENAGHVFRFPDLEAALRHELLRNDR
ncbi:TIGR01777 family oxidoreductase [Corynebacterium sp. NPDC060344]|uniref:TIGR01777 family oxidoreductase n=1 Tax=Corynebacterium sp. NPDC060344 TaxID=3347101 RepID=UPI003654F23F